MKHGKSPGSPRSRLFFGAMGCSASTPAGRISTRLSVGETEIEAGKIEVFHTCFVVFPLVLHGFYMILHGVSMLFDSFLA